MQSSHYESLSKHFGKRVDKKKKKISSHASEAAYLAFTNNYTGLLRTE